MSMSDTAGDVLVEPTPVDVLPTPSPPPPPPKAAAAPSPSSLLPSPIFPLSSAAQLLYSDQQRERAETTDDGVSPYLLQRRKFYTDDKWQTLLAQLAATRTLYVGNLSFYTTEAQLFAFFSLCGRPLRLVMGLNERTMTPCGFCFVEFATHEEALNCQRHLSGLMADERVVRADIDPGFEEGRQFGRSKLTGGQIRDDHRKDFDPGRGGYVLHQATSFTSLTPGMLVIRPTRSRKKQRIDLAAVRASRKERPRGGSRAGERRAEAADGRQPQPAQGTDEAAVMERVGAKRRRRDEDEEEDARLREEVAEEEEEKEEEEGDAAVDEGADMEERAGYGEDAVDEVVTSGAEGDIESAAEVDGEGEGGGRRRGQAADSQQPPQQSSAAAGTEG